MYYLKSRVTGIQATSDGYSAKRRKGSENMSNIVENQNTWMYDKETGLRYVFVPSISSTPVSRSNGGHLYDCPGCSNIWSLSTFRNPSDVVSRTTPVREGGVTVDFAISAARLSDCCWCGVPFPKEVSQQITDIQARANVKAALRIALSREGESPSLLDDIQTLRTKVTPTVLRHLRGERSKVRGVA